MRLLRGIPSFKSSCTYICSLSYIREHMSWSSWLVLIRYLFLSLVEHHHHHKMFYGKLAIFILLVCAITSSCVGTLCTPEQKEKLLYECRPWIKQGFNKYHLPKDSTCCEETRKVSNMYMGIHYVILMLSPDERKIYNVGNILKLTTRCQLHPLPHPTQNHVKVMGRWSQNTHVSTIMVWKRII